MFKISLTNEQVTFELVPPNQHHRNAAERVSRTFTTYFLSGLATCNPAYPLQKWDRNIPQSAFTLSLLLNSRLNPKLLSWAYLFGNFDFNKSPLLPLGTKIILHTKPGKRASWDFHGEQEYYIGPTINHYRSITCYVSKIHREWITYTAKIIPKHIPIPQSSYEDHLR